MKFKTLAAFAAVSFWLILFAFSCNRDDISFENPSQLLRFSADTVFCDTVYNQIRSETYAVKVYNDEDKDVMIPRISLAGGSTSQYRINVDGKSGTEFTNVPLRKKDSLYIFVEIAPVANNIPEAIAEDQILFETPAGNQHVTLFSVVQDAEFFIESDTNPNIINTSTWTNDKVKIIFGNLTLAEGQTLTIDKGTKICFYKNSGMKISKNATLEVDGDLGSEVVFRGVTVDKFDPGNDEVLVPLNWNSISFDENSTLIMNYAKIYGGTTGLEFHKINEANITNTIIHTFQDYGIYSVNSKITAVNLVTNSCGQAALGIFGGGEIDLAHCTIANYWYLKFGLPEYGIYATNEWTNENGDVETYPLTALNIYNSIVYGTAENAIEFSESLGNFSPTIQNCLLKYTANTATYDIGNSITDDPLFNNFFTKLMDLRVADDSPAKEGGEYDSAFSKDILGITRNNPPTIGAYE
ncbi:MAG: hypothetical protein LBE36_02655 [Flavobacteriaceae bacterium]|jgi:hypothetical protein|nr:hypothetical protein [Flavobacteriaceae bacterium]